MFNQEDNSSTWYNISGGGIHSLYLKQVYLEQTNVRIYDKQNAFLCVASFKGFCINCTNHHVFRSTDMGFTVSQHNMIIVLPKLLTVLVKKCGYVKTHVEI